MPSAEHRTRCHGSRIILPVEDGGDVLGVQAVEVKMKPAWRFALGRGGWFARSPRLQERRGGPRHQRSRGHGAGRVYPGAP
jgi:hypothetical protein